jgi:hypothetical protein
MSCIKLSYGVEMSGESIVEAQGDVFVSLLESCPKPFGETSLSGSMRTSFINPALSGDFFINQKAFLRRETD